MAPAPTVSKFPTIEKRDIRFPIEEIDLGTWHPEGRHVSHYFNALSIFFPEGEAFFIDTVLHYADRIEDPKLREEVKGFTGQEAMHGREHRRYNRALADGGLPAKELEDAAVTLLDEARKRLNPLQQLSVTIALEHFTAIMADALLSDDRGLEGADPDMAAIWRWHAIEETEHKAVAYDVYQAVAPNPVTAYLLRTTTMATTTVTFLLMIARTHWRIMKEDGHARDLRGWGRLFRFLFVRPGAMRKIIGPWLSYFRPGFHPWQHQNQHHVDRWKQAYEAADIAAA